MNLISPQPVITITRRSAIIAAALGAVSFALPKPAFANLQRTSGAGMTASNAKTSDDLTALLFENEDFRIDRTGEQQLRLINKITGEEIIANGSLAGEEGVLYIYHPNGKTTVATKEFGTVYINGMPFISELEVPETRACVEITRKRYVVDTTVANWQDILLSTAAGAIGGAIVSGLLLIIRVIDNLQQTTAYVETIRYYCDTPSPRERYVTNYYSDASFTNLVQSYTTETIFQNP